MTTFARVSMMGVHSDLQVQNCDFKYRLFKESQDNTFSSYRNISYIFFRVGRKRNQDGKLRERTKDGHQRYRKKIKSNQSSLGIQLHFPSIFTQVSILHFFPIPSTHFREVRAKRDLFVFSQYFFKGYLQHFSSKKMLNLNNLSEKLANDFFHCLTTTSISL